MCRDLTQRSRRCSADAIALSDAEDRVAGGDGQVLTQATSARLAEETLAFQEGRRRCQVVGSDLWQRPDGSGLLLQPGRPVRPLGRRYRAGVILHPAGVRKCCGRGRSQRRAVSRVLVGDEGDRPPSESGCSDRVRLQ